MSSEMKVDPFCQWLDSWYTLTSGCASISTSGFFKAKLLVGIFACNSLKNGTSAPSGCGGGCGSISTSTAAASAAAVWGWWWAVAGGEKALGLLDSLKDGSLMPNFGADLGGGAAGVCAAAAGGVCAVGSGFAGVSTGGTSILDFGILVASSTPFSDCRLTSRSMGVGICKIQKSHLHIAESRYYEQEYKNADVTR